MRAPVTFKPESRPVLTRSVRMRFDKARSMWLILAPEKVIAPDEICVEILQLCDGQRSIDEVSAALAEKFTAPAEEIRADVIALLDDLGGKGVVIDAATREDRRNDSPAES